jgi:NurA-like 5'-3' nuclease
MQDRPVTGFVWWRNLRVPLFDPQRRDAVTVLVVYDELMRSLARFKQCACHDYVANEFATICASRLNIGKLSAILVRSPFSVEDVEEVACR